MESRIRTPLKTQQGDFLDFFFSYALYSTLLHLPPLRFHCDGGCLNRTQDCCDFGTGSHIRSNHSARSHPLKTLRVHNTKARRNLPAGRGLASKGPGQELGLNRE
jgi:hypothetical protein